ncbi:MAG: hypothetical protein LBI45_05245 [Bacteroidales bacterium]|nr:hypothetical protein [Bacteroidales bacterium]
MKNLKQKFLVVVFLVLANAGMSFSAQSQGAVLSIFTKYGTNKGVTMLEASRVLMKEYKIKTFKSIIFDDGTRALPEIRKCIEIEKDGALSIKESTKDGLLTSGYYQLKSKNTNLKRYLIFKVGNNNKTTFIYVEGELSPDDLVELLK